MISLRHLVGTDFQQAFQKVLNKELNATDSFKLLRWCKKMEKCTQEIYELHAKIKASVPDADPLVDEGFLKVLEGDSGLDKLPKSILEQLNLSVKEACALECIFEDL